MSTDLLNGLALSAAVLILMACYVILRLINEVLWLREDLQEASDVEHAKCLAAVMAYVGDEWAAQVLEVAAADYESVESQGDLDRISRLLYKPGGSPVPSIWLRERADRLRIMLDAAALDGAPR